MTTMGQVGRALQETATAVRSAAPAIADAVTSAVPAITSARSAASTVAQVAPSLSAVPKSAPAAKGARTLVPLTIETADELATGRTASAARALAPLPDQAAKDVTGALPGTGARALTPLSVTTSGEFAAALPAERVSGAPLPAEEAAALIEELRRVIRDGDAAAGSLLTTRGNRFTVLGSAEEYYRDAAEHIARANHFVDFETFGMQPLQEGGLTGQVVHAMTERASRPGDAIPVTVMADQIGAGFGWRNRRSEDANAFWKMLEDAGVETAIKPFRLDRGGLNDNFAAVDHRKIIVIDGEVGYIGGINAVDAWNDMDDVMVRIEGPAAAQLGTLVAGRRRDLGLEVTPERVAVLERGLSTAATDIRDGAAQLITNGNRHRKELTKHYLDTIRRGADELWVLSPTYSDKEGMEAILERVRSGKTTHVLVSPSELGGENLKRTLRNDPPDLLNIPLRQAWATRLAQAGAEVTLLPHHSHGKALLETVTTADGARRSTATVGSQNIDGSAMRRNYEASVVSSDPGLTEPMRGYLEMLRDTGTQLTNENIPRSWKVMARLQSAFGISV